MAEVVACNKKLRKLITKDKDKGCCVMICVITWATMLARVWGLMMKYIDEREADWFENEIMLRL